MNLTVFFKQYLEYRFRSKTDIKNLLTALGSGFLIEFSAKKGYAQKFKPLLKTETANKNLSDNPTQYFGHLKRFCESLTYYK